jgi:hypothetical protein
MELTQEYFDQMIAKLATKEDITVIRKDLDAQSRDLKAHAEELQAELARMVHEGFTDMQERLDVNVRVKKLESDMRELRNALHLST